MAIKFPYLLLATALVVFTGGCSPVCDRPLTGQESKADLEAACVLPQSLPETWSCNEPLPVVPTLHSLEQLHRRCGLQALGSARAFARSAGEPIKSALIYRWLREHGIAGAAKAAKLYLEEPLVPIATHLPSVRRAEPKPFAKPQVITEELRPDGSWGHYGYWHVQLPNTKRTVALSSELTLNTVRHLLASLAQADSPLQIVVESETLTYVELYPPTSESYVSINLTQSQRPLVPDSSVVRLTGSHRLSVARLADALAHYQPRRVELALEAMPCLPHSPDMRCVEGSTSLATFYIDRAPISDDGACKREKVCSAPSGQFRYAAQLCSYLGKRLPTLYEARTAGLPATESIWTQTVHAPGAPPLGACGGLYPCAKRHERLLADATPRHVNDRLNATIYCASDFPVEATYPPFMVRTPLPEVAPPVRDTGKAALASSLIEHDNLEDKGICGEDVRSGWKEHQQRGGRATTACRDPYSYVTTNEPRRFVWGPYIRNLGGGYAGVGADQNYDLIAEARSQWAWIFDYDPNVYRLHQILKPLVLASDTAQDFVNRFSPNPKTQATAADIITQYYDNQGTESLVRFYYGYRKRLYRHYRKSFKLRGKSAAFSWLSNPKHYHYIRTLHEQARIIPVKGDMLATKGLRSIGKAAEALGTPIRIYYTSNAPTAWGGEITPEYKDNVLSFPFDPQSVMLATYSARQYGQRGYWLFTVSHGLTMQRRIAQAESNRFLVWDRIPSPDPDLALCQVPSRLPGQ